MSQNTVTFTPTYKKTSNITTNLDPAVNLMTSLKGARFDPLADVLRDLPQPLHTIPGQYLNGLTRN
jgi:hypothetical protein